MLDFVLDEVPTTASGQISPIYAKTIESAVVRKISTSMGEDLSVDETDPTDVGVVCFVDPTQNIITTSKLNVSGKVRPFGYNRWINFLIGFQLEN